MSVVSKNGDLKDLEGDPRDLVKPRGIQFEDLVARFLQHVKFKH